MMFTQNDVVEIHSLGSSENTFEGRICGLSIDWGDSPATIWIVECPELGKNVGFSHMTFPQSCLRLKAKSKAAGV